MNPSQASLCELRFVCRNHAIATERWQRRQAHTIGFLDNVAARAAARIASQLVARRAPDDGFAKQAIGSIASNWIASAQCFLATDGAGNLMSR